jgi:hypothetical protein
MIAFVALALLSSPPDKVREVRACVCVPLSLRSGALRDIVGVRLARSDHLIVMGT